VLLDGVFDGDAVDPDVLREQDGSFRLYYFRGHFVTPPPPLPEPSRFYSAHSSDGLNFSIDGEVFALDNSTDPSVVRLPDGRRLLAVAQNNAGTMAVRFAISSGDGRSLCWRPASTAPALNLPCRRRLLWLCAPAVSPAAAPRRRSSWHRKRAAAPLSPTDRRSEPGAASRRRLVDVLQGIQRQRHAGTRRPLRCGWRSRSTAIPSCRQRGSTPVPDGALLPAP
jgi:hypothetical protein